MSHEISKGEKAGQKKQRFTDSRFRVFCEPLQIKEETEK